MPHRRPLEAVRAFAIFVAALACVLLAPLASRAAATEWIGGPTGVWNFPGGWSGGVVPNNDAAATYVATVAQAVSQYTQLTLNLPSVELDQLNLRSVATVIVPTGSVLRLRDIGSGSSLTRGLIGGGELRLNGGRLDIALNGATLSSAEQVYLSNDGRIGGSGTFANARFIRGSGTVGNAVGEFGSALTINNVGSPNTLFYDITANRNLETLTLGPGGAPGTVGIRNNYATLRATNGGILVLRGNGTTIDNSNGTLTADAGSEIQLRANATITGGVFGNPYPPSLSNPPPDPGGTGIVRVPVGEVATLRSLRINLGSLVIDGTVNGSNLTVGSPTTVARVVISNTLNAEGLINESKGTIQLLPTASVPNPILKATTSIQNSGTLSGGGTINAYAVTNNFSNNLIVADVAATPLKLKITGIGYLGSSFNLRAINNASLILGDPGDTNFYGAGTFTTLAGASLVFNAPINTPGSALVNNGTVNVNSTSTLNAISGVGTVVVNGYLTTLNSFRAATVIVNGNARIQPATSTAARVGSLTVNGSATFDVNGALVIDYTASSPSSTGSPLATLRADVAAGRVRTSSTGLVIGYGEASALGAPAAWNGESIDATTLLILSTRRGDATLDRKVDFDDLLALARHYDTTSGAAWTDGDSNYDGAVDFSDLLALAKNYTAPTPPPEALAVSIATDWALARSLVPEPASLFATTLVMIVATRRRSIVAAANLLAR